ncbi:MAG: hypothetical protein AAGH68_15720 [Pseudomonadota bacterium]
MDEGTPRRFFLIAPSRSGSTMLSERLHSHPDVICFGEVLNGNGSLWHPAPVPDGMREGDPHGSDIAGFLDTEVWPWHARVTGAVGLKILETDYMRLYSELGAYLSANPDIGAIFLRRENLLERFVSAQVAVDTGVWAVGDARARPDVGLVTIDPEILAGYFRTEGLQRLAVRRHFEGRRVHEVTYEALVDGPAAEDAGLCRFLGVKDRPLSHRNVQMRHRPLAERVANYAELTQAFTDTPFAGFFQ